MHVLSLTCCILQPAGFNSCPQFLVDNPLVTGICKSDADNNPNTANKTFLERVCCGDCRPWKAAHHDGLSTAKKVGIVSGVLGSLLATFLIGLGVYWMLRSKESPVSPPPIELPGTDSSKMRLPPEMIDQKRY